MNQNKTHRPRRDWRKAAVSALAVFMALLILLPIFSMVVTSARAVTQSEINQLKNEAQELDAQREELEDKLSGIEDDLSQAMEKKNLLEQQINVLQAEINNTTKLINEYSALIEEKEVELAEAEAEEQRYYELFCQRVRDMEEGERVSYWAILFNSADFADLLDQMSLISEIMEYDNNVMDSLAAARQAVADAKAVLEESKAEQEAARADLEARKSQLNTQQKEVDALVAQIQAQQGEVEEALDDLEAAASAMDREIAELERKLQQELNQSGQTIVSESGYAWPLPASNNVITSLFAGRIHPITGKPQHHTGTDIRAAKNTEIYSAKSGIVITSTYNSSYGNYVVVSHGNGVSTLYAHMNSRAVSVGDSVSQGQVIGYVGTTGSSTGYHLHYEVRINGTRVDALQYYPDKYLQLLSGGKLVSLQG